MLALRCVCLTMILLMLLLQNILTSSSTIVKSASSLSATKPDGPNWTVVKDEVVTHVNNTDPDDSASKNVKTVKQALADNTKDALKCKLVSKKDPSLFTCRNITLKPGEYDISDNGTLHAKAFRLTLNSTLYVKNGNFVTICKPTKKEELSTCGKALLGVLTFFYSLITMLSAMCTFSKNSTYLKLALVSWICVSSNIFLWTIVILVITGSQSLFAWVSMSVNMNQSVYLTSAWMALLTSNIALKFLQKYTFIEIYNRTVTVKVGYIGVLCVMYSIGLATMNFMLDQLEFFENDVLIDCLFCNPLLYGLVCAMIIVEGFLAPCQKNVSDVSRDYASYHFALCRFSVFNFFCIGIGTVAAMYEWHLLLWIYTLFNFLWPLFFIRNIIPQFQTLMAIVSDDDESEEKYPLTPSYLIPKKRVELNILIASAVLVPQKRKQGLEM